jgi:hypothetical protein
LAQSGHWSAAAIELALFLLVIFFSFFELRFFFQKQFLDLGELYRIIDGFEQTLVVLDVLPANKTFHYHPPRPPRSPLR